VEEKGWGGGNEMGEKGPVTPFSPGPPPMKLNSALVQLVCLCPGQALCCYWNDWRRPALSC